MDKVRAALILVQVLGIVSTLLGAAAIGWLYTSQPRTLQDVARGAQVAAGTYQIDQARFEAALALFHREQFRPARDEWLRADPARQDPRTQFYIAYAFYREGWGRFHHDDFLYRQGLEAVKRAQELVPEGNLMVKDPGLQLRTVAELKTELERGQELTWSDVNPMRAFEGRK